MSPLKSTTATAHPPETDRTRPIRIVAIGASAGGLEAFSSLLRALPAEIRMAFLLIQHLDPKRQSLLPELLTRVTHIPVREVTQGTTVELNHVYVMPSDCDMVLKDGHFTLIPRTTAREIHCPIDVFMQSLAKVAEGRAVGVVLSGTGSDGTKGVEAIRAAGGVTFAQDPKTAKFDGMPRSAIEAGSIDMVLSPEAIAQELARMAAHPRIEQAILKQAKKRKGSGVNPPGAPPDDSEPQSQPDEGLDSVLTLLRRSRGCDFSEYKSNTLRRRTQQRMASLRLNSMEEYRKYLEEHPEEIDKLRSHLLIPVTQFFRDPEVFAALKKTVYPAIAGEKSLKGHIRIWVPACSTGEEAYSLAIALLEYLGAKSAAFRIQIFGSDINAAGIAKARSGIYPATIDENVSEERLQRFFTRAEGGYRVAAAVREMCIFAQQDVTADPPFSNLDLISCRNLLIYIEPDLQERIISVLHYSLKPKGFLLLGHSESADSYPQLFTATDKKSKIYAKRMAAHRPQHDFWRSQTPDEPEGKFSPATVAPGRQDTQSEVHLQQIVDRMVLSRFAPPGVVVNDSLEILQFRGRTSPYLDPASGRASFNLLKMVREELAMALRGAIAAARKKGVSVAKKDVAFEHNGRQRNVDLSVIPIDAQTSAAERFYLILFEESALRPILMPKGRKGSKSADAARLVATLKRDLASSRAMLRDNIAAQDALREDYQSANEELLSANEELQSTNEELETSKEELQSANEELTTVNDELSSSNFELNLLSNDLVNLLDSTIIPVVMVDRGLCIRRMTPAAERIFKVLPQDVGRRITDMGTDLDLDMKPLLLSVVQDVVSVDREVRDHEGVWYRLQIKPYKTLDGKINGAILALIDIDSMKKINEQLTAAGEFTASIVETMPSPVLVLTHDLRVKAANGSFYAMFDAHPEETLGRSVYELGNGQWDVPELRSLLENVLPAREGFSNFEVVLEVPGIGAKLIQVSGRYMAQIPGADPLVLLSFADLTERKKAEAALIQAEKLSIAGRLAASIAHEVNNPLEAVTNLIYLAASEEIELATARSYMRQALDQLQRVSHITQQTLRFHRQSAGPSAVKVHELLDSVIDLFHARLRAQNISVKRQYDGDPSAMLLASDIRQVFANIVGNAIEAMPTGGSLTARVRPSQDWRNRARAGVRVTIGDSGSGMNPKVRRRIYEPFFTANKSEGTGLGMWVAAQLVERHQGDLHVWSTPRQGSSGTVFSLFLPLDLSERRLKAAAETPV